MKKRNKENKMISLIKKNKKEKIFAICMFMYGLVMLFIIPTWQTPDEYTHLQIIGKSIKNEEFAELIEDSMKLDYKRMIYNSSEKADISQQLKAMVKKPDYSTKDVKPKGIQLNIIKHFPSTVGILLGILLKLPTYWVLQLGEIFALLFYVFVCYNSMKLMPLKKELFAMVMLIPMALQQAGSIGYDAVLLPLCFFFVADVFYLKLEKEEIVLSDFLLLGLIEIIVFYIKMPYCLLILLILILPLEKIHVRIFKFKIDKERIKKCRIPMITFLLVFVICGIYTLKDNFWIQLVLGVLEEWKRTLYLVYQTVKVWHEFLIVSSIGNFGWLDTPINYGIAILVYIMFLLIAFVNGDEKENSLLSIWDRIVIWGTGILLTFFTTIALINHTIMVTLYGSEFVSGTYDLREALYQIPYIGGVQGRYYIPFLILFFLPIPQIRRINKKVSTMAVITFEVCFLVYILYVLFVRYWGC